MASKPKKAAPPERADQSGAQFGARVERWVVDSLQGSVASVEVDDGRMMTVARATLPQHVREGQVLRATFASAAADAQPVRVEIDEAATAAAMAESAKQVEKHSGQGNDPGGDITL